MSPTSLPAPGSSWMVAGSSVPPAPAHTHQQGDVRCGVMLALSLISLLLLSLSLGHFSF